MSMNAPIARTMPQRARSVVRPGIPPASRDAYTARLPLDDSPRALLVLYDGLRGVGASADVIEAFEEQAQSLVELALRAPAEAPERYLQALQQMAAEANTRVYNKSRYRGSSGLRAAIAAIAVVDRRAFIVDIGGNSIYLVRDRHVRAIAEPDPAEQIIYAGEQERIPQLSVSGRPDFIHSFLVELALDDRLVICTKALAAQLAERAGERAATIGDAVRRHADPADAARELTELDPFGSARALWRPLEQVPSAARSAELSGGAIVLWCANGDELRRAEGERGRRQVGLRVLTLLALLIFISGLLAGSSRALANHSRAIFQQTSTAAGASQTKTATPVVTPMPTDRPLPTLALTPLPALGETATAARPTRTLTPTRVPTQTFTPSPTNTPTPTLTPTPTSTSTPTPKLKKKSK